MASKQDSHLEISETHISPFYRGFVWGIVITLTVVTSATIGAIATLQSPSLFETIQSLDKLWFKRNINL